VKYQELQFELFPDSQVPAPIVLDLNEPELAEIEMLGFDAVNAMQAQLDSPAEPTEPEASHSPEGQMTFLANFGPVETLAYETEAQRAVRDIFDDPTEAKAIHSAMAEVFGQNGLSEIELVVLLKDPNPRNVLKTLFGEADHPTFEIVSEVAETIADAYIEPMIAVHSESHVPDTSQAYAEAKTTILLAMHRRYRLTSSQPSLFLPDVEAA